VTAIRVPAPALRSHVATMLTGMGARNGDADRVAQALVDADLCGHRSHGVRQLPYYANQLRRVEIDPTTEISIVEDSGQFLVVDGRLGFGQVIAADAVDLAAERAQGQRIAAVAVRNANHIGRLGEYTEMVAAKGLIGILLVTCQGAGQQLAPIGGIDRRLTNNPVSIALAGPDFPLVLDMALSEVAESRVLHAAELGTTVPEGWVLDAGGHPTTEPSDYLAGGSLLPVGGANGGHKGYALILLVELVVALLSGATVCGPEDRPFSNAFLLIVLNPDGDPRGTAKQLVDWVKTSRTRGDAGEILVPGELEARRRQESHGVVELDTVTVAQLDEIAMSLGMEARVPAAGPDLATETA
jgi:hydroxycarboxylate dehydrogenase B